MIQLFIVWLDFRPVTDSATWCCN